ncbi:MAG TPA: sigma-70 family RNA polymerase sigma factor [Ramlibacter sp.]|jgi:RNA polymerase sigma-70 factor (ECF subfamily)|uniref:sigma-70 family RNA polymerase sigma factor n=1 Tax=Ramlibacter sp. TaxID=1917967 RepID=UPI002D3DA104|nr:sigma-70 family RNA polymerase sigma factor [Ramlibacter sp.]HZY18608.1 sigma-70 family RNA polymerase sigma factor [Ramlibacter sp.]
MPLHTADLEAQIPQLRRYARALTGDTWAADDLVQDTLERACDRWQLWKAGSDLRAWLFTLMHNLFVDGVRRAVRQAGQRVDIDDVAQELSAPGGMPDQALDLQRCLLRLPEEQREVLLLVALQDLSYQEVATITGTPIGTVMSRLSRARARLRELMEGATTPAPAAAVVPLVRMK